MRSPTYRHFRNTAGFTILEGLVASAVVGVAVIGTTSLARYMYAQSHRAQVLNRAVMVQTALVNALLNKNQYAKGFGRDGVIDAMNSSGSAAGLEILAEPGTPGTPVLAVVGQRRGYGLDGTDASCNGSACPIQVDVDFDCGSLTSLGCMVAYRVSIVPDPGDVTPAPLGAMPGPVGNPNGFLPTDYNMGLSHDFFTQKLTSDCAENDAGGENILITGLNRTTGEVSCIAKQATECRAPMIAHGVAATTNGGRKRLELQCHELANVQCPAEYVLQTFDYGQLDAGKGFGGGTRPGMCGTCVYRWKTDIDWQGPAFQTAPTSASASYAAKVCNTTYYDAFANGSCSVVWDSNPPVYCPQTCSDTDADGNVISTYDCSYYISASASTSSTPPSGANNRASCTINVQQASCSGGTTSGVAHGAWSGQCRVKERIPNPTLKKPVTGGSMCTGGPPPPPPLQTVGVCGPSNGSTSATAPTAGLCASGAASAVAGAGPWSWTCAGSGGGLTATCSASLAAAPGGGTPGGGPTNPTPTSGTWTYVNTTPGQNVSASNCPGGSVPQGACSPLGAKCGTSLIGMPGNPANGTGMILNFECK